MKFNDSVITYRRISINYYLSRVIYFDPIYQLSHFQKNFKNDIVDFSSVEKTILLIVGLAVFLLGTQAFVSSSYGSKAGPGPNPTPAPNPAIDSSQLLITKRFGNTVTIPPGKLSSSDASCQSDESITGGGYGSSSPGVRAKDVQIVKLEGGKEKWRVNAYNDDPTQSVTLRAQVYCGKLIE